MKLEEVFPFYRYENKIPMSDDIFITHCVMGG